MAIRQIITTPFLIIMFLLSMTTPTYAGGGQETGDTASDAAPVETAAEGQTTEGPEISRPATVQYARHFTIEYAENYKVLRVTNPWQNANKSYTYVLYPRNGVKPNGFHDAVYVETPVRSIVTMSTSYLAFLDQLSVLDTLVGTDYFRFIYSPKVRSMAEEGRLKEVGSGPDVNVEQLYDLGPDIIMTYGLGTEYDTHPKLIEAGLTVVINGDHTELTPIARLEWIKFIAAFYNKEEQAAVIFNEKAEKYIRMADKAKNIKEKPTVLNNAPYQGVWWIAGGSSYAARLIEDAGGDYLWSDNEQSGSLMLDFEAVFEKASDVDFWINPGIWKSLDEARAEDERYTEFKAFRQGNVYNNNRRMNEHGFSDYWESGVANPDVVLADLISIFHPDLLPDHELVYYKKLK